MSQVHRGSCLCGGVRYEYEGEFKVFVYCHCSQCRKAQGSAFGSNAPVEAAKFRLLQGRDLLKAYESSPGKERVFCGVCGSPLYSRLRGKPELLRLRMGSLDTPPGFKPQAHIFAADKAVWHDITDDLPQHAQRPD